jgi:opacity protein-like surface antigen
MFGKKLVVTLIAGVAAMALPAFSQSENPEKNEVSVQAFGSFVKSSTDNGIQNSATNSGGVLSSYRYFFNAHNGVEANYGYSLNTQNYSSTSGVLGVKSHSHEISAAYVFRFPMRKFTPFVLAGAGGLIFDPKDFVGAGSQGRAAFVYGGGTDVNLSQHVFVRAEYRGFVYNSRPTTFRVSRAPIALPIVRNLLLGSGTDSKSFAQVGTGFRLRHASLCCRSPQSGRQFLAVRHWADNLYR